MRQQAIDSAMPAFEALAGVGRVDDAMAVAKSVFGVDGSAPVREQLLAAARRAGNEELAKRLADGR
jgi:hypothetical protein